MVKCMNCQYWNAEEDLCFFKHYMTLDPQKDRNCEQFEEIEPEIDGKEQE